MVSNAVIRGQHLKAGAALAFRAALVALGYYLCGYIGTVLSLAPSGFAIVWPATALLVAVLLLRPYREWWAYVVALVPTHLLLVGYVQSPHVALPPLSVVLTQLGGNVVLAVGSALAVRRLAPQALRVDSFRGVLTLMLVAGFAAPALMNMLILSVHVATGWTQDLWLSWRQWMLSSVFPTITIVPLALSARKGLAVPRAALAEIGAVCSGLFLLGFVAYGGAVAQPYWPVLLVAPVPLLIWAAVRGGVFGACLSLLVFAGAILLRAMQGHGPFAQASPIDSVLSLQVYLTAVSASLVLLAALEEDRRRSVAELRRSRERIRMAAAATDTGLWQWDRATGRLWTTEHCAAMFGRGDTGLAALGAILESVHVDDRGALRRAFEAVAGPGEADVTGEFRVLRDDGELRWFNFAARGEKERDGRVVRVSGVFRDITARIAAEARADELTHRLLTLQEEERRGIAEELHDSTGQHLVAMGLSLQALERRLKPSAEVRSLLVDIQGLLARSLAELRTFTFLLRPPELERYGLSEVLQRYVEGFGRRTGLATLLRLSGLEDALTTEQQRAVLRIVQESLANVYRHAAAKRVAVTLRVQGHALHVFVRDDGRGMDAAALRHGAGRLSVGVGIPGMTARADELGGRMVIRSSPGGTTVHAAFPTSATAPQVRRDAAVALKMSRRPATKAGAGLRIRAQGR